MAIFKKSIIIILCVTLAFSPLLYCGDFSYADDEPTATNWLPCDTEEMIVRGAKAFLKVNNFYWTYSPVGQFYKWTYNHLEEQASNQGYTMTEISQGMKYRYMDNGKIQFYFTAGCLQMLNDVYEGMLLNLGITPNSFKTVYSGKYYIDGNGNHIMVFMARSNIYTSWEGNRLQVYDKFSGLGQKWLHNGSDYASLNSVTFPVPNGDRTYNIITQNGPNYGTYQSFICINSNSTPVYVTSGYHSGYDGILYSSYFNEFYACTFLDYDMLNQDGTINQRKIKIATFGLKLPTTNDNNGNASVNANQGNEPQNPFEPDTDYTIDEPDDDNDEPEPTPVEPTPPPAPPTDPYVPNPTGGNEDENGNFNWQMPDINVDWDLGDFSDIFPFSIPYDIIELFDIVDSEPVTPAIYQEVDFGAFNYTIDFDLSYFDEFMEYVRAMELFLYTLTLFIATRGIFKIY